MSDCRRWSDDPRLTRHRTPTVTDTHYFELLFTFGSTHHLRGPSGVNNVATQRTQNCSRPYPGANGPEQLLICDLLAALRENIVRP